MAKKYPCGFCGKKCGSPRLRTKHTKSCPK
jgi:hypothetical protein